MIILLEKAANSIPSPSAGKATLYVDTTGNLSLKDSNGNFGSFYGGGITATGPVNLGPIGNLTITGGTAGYVMKTYGNGTVYWDTDSATAGGSNTQVLFNDLGSINGNTGFTFNKTTGVLSLTGNGTFGNLSATLVTGTLTTNAQPNITSVGTLSSLAVTANANVGNLGTAGLITRLLRIT